MMIDENALMLLVYVGVVFLALFALALGLWWRHALAEMALALTGPVRCRVQGVLQFRHHEGNPGAMTFCDDGVVLDWKGEERDESRFLAYGKLSVAKAHAGLIRLRVDGGGTWTIRAEQPVPRETLTLVEELVGKTALSGDDSVLAHK